MNEKSTENKQSIERFRFAYLAKQLRIDLAINFFQLTVQRLLRRVETLIRLVLVRQVVRRIAPRIRIRSKPSRTRQDTAY